MSTHTSKEKLLITCASGKQGTHLIPFLLPKWKRLRLAVNSDSSRQDLLKKYISPNIEVVQADLAQPSDCQRVLDGVKAVFHIGPSFHPRETEIGYNMIDAAAAESVQHFVYSSVLHPLLRKLVNHDCKRYVEEYLIESGLQYTILQPSHFMDMFPIEQLIEEKQPVYRAQWDPEVPFSYTSLDDLGEAAVKILEQREAHCYATYQLVSTSPPMGYRQVCDIASKKIGEKIQVEVVPFQEVSKKAEAMLGVGADVYTRDTGQRMLLYYNERGLVGSTSVLRWLLGREPTQWEDWVGRKLKKKE